MKQSGREALIIGACRTAVGRGHPEKGMFRDLHPADLLGRTFVELLRRSGVDPAEVENGQVSLAAFDRADECAVQAALGGQFLLRQLLALPCLAKVVAQLLQEGLVVEVHA